MKQKFQLGDAVWAYKQQSKEQLVKVHGIVQSVEIDPSGFIFYKVVTLQQTKEGLKPVSIMANHASMALLEPEIDTMIETYKKFQEEQREKFNATFGANEFEPNFVDNELMKGVQ